MFPARFFTSAYFPLRFWPKIGDVAVEPQPGRVTVRTSAGGVSVSHRAAGNITLQ